MPCPEVVAVSYIREAEVLTLFSVEGDAQVEQKNHATRFLTSVFNHLILRFCPAQVRQSPVDSS